MLLEHVYDDYSSFPTDLWCFSRFYSQIRIGARHPTPKLRLGARSGTLARLASVPKPGGTAGPVASGDRTMRLASG